MYPLNTLNEASEGTYRSGSSVTMRATSGGSGCLRGGDGERYLPGGLRLREYLLSSRNLPGGEKSLDGCRPLSKSSLPPRLFLPRPLLTGDLSLANGDRSLCPRPLAAPPLGASLPFPFCGFEISKCTFRPVKIIPCCALIAVSRSCF